MITLIPKRKIQGSQELMNSIALEDTSGILPLDDTAVDGRTQEGITSNWAYDHNAKTTGTHGVTGTIVGTEDLGVASQGDVTGSRAIDGTAYRNTSGKIRIVTIQCYCETTNATGYSRVTFHCDTNATPTTQIGLVGLDVADDDSGTATHKGYFAFTFVVIPNNYYKATASANAATTPVLGDWFEWDLL